MSLIVKNTRALIDPDKLKLKILVYALPGVGKTTFAATAPNPGFAVCETGEGSGLLSVAAQGLDYVEPSSYQDFQAVCSGQVFKDKETIVLDSLSDMANTFIKDYALAMPRNAGNSPKRAAGIPELDDYGVMGEVTRRLIRKLLDVDKHIIVTATERYQTADPEKGIYDTTIGPALPGMMFLGAPAMFDFVLRMRTRSKLRDKNDAKSRYSERYFITENDGRGTIGKCRSVYSNKPLLDPEEIFSPVTGEGSFDYLIKKIIAGYKAEGSVKETK